MWSLQLLVGLDTFVSGQFPRLPFFSCSCGKTLFLQLLLQHSVQSNVLAVEYELAGIWGKESLPGKILKAFDYTQAACVGPEIWLLLCSQEESFGTPASVSKSLSCSLPSIATILTTNVRFLLA